MLTLLSYSAFLKVGFGDHLCQNHLKYLSKIQISVSQQRNPEFKCGMQTMEETFK